LSFPSGSSLGVLSLSGFEFDAHGKSSKSIMVRILNDWNVTKQIYIKHLLQRFEIGKAKFKVENNAIINMIYTIIFIFAKNIVFYVFSVFIIEWPILGVKSFFHFGRVLIYKLRFVVPSHVIREFNNNYFFFLYYIFF
jgi:hypothetical protein